MALVTAFISAGGLILGSVIGALCSVFVNRVSLKEQLRIQQENLEFQEKYRVREKFTNANIIRLDLCTTIYQSIRCLQHYDDLSYFYSMPICRDYNKIVASLCDEYSLRELSYIYQLYGIIDKIYYNICDARSLEKNNFNELIDLRNLLKSVLKRIYGDNLNKVLSIDIDNISYEELYEDNLMEEGYRNIFKSLDELCKKHYTKNE